MSKGWRNSIPLSTEPAFLRGGGGKFLSPSLPSMPSRAGGNTTIPAVAVEASMYGAVGTSAEVTLLATHYLPGQVTFAIANGLNTVAVSSEALGLVFAFNDGLIVL